MLLSAGASKFCVDDKFSLYDSEVVVRNLNMATKLSRSVWNAKNVWTLRDAPASQLVNNGGRYSLQRTIATAPSTLGAPPLLLKLRSDLKSAMKAKDTNRLAAIDALIQYQSNRQ